MKRSIRDIVRAELWARRRLAYDERCSDGRWPGGALLDVDNGVVVRLRLWRR